MCEVRQLDRGGKGSGGGQKISKIYLIFILKSLYNRTK